MSTTVEGWMKHETHFSQFKVLLQPLRLKPSQTLAFSSLCHLAFDASNRFKGCRLTDLKLAMNFAEVEQNRHDKLNYCRGERKIEGDRYAGMVKYLALIRDTR